MKVTERPDKSGWYWHRYAGKYDTTWEIVNIVIDVHGTHYFRENWRENWRGCDGVVEVRYDINRDWVYLGNSPQITN